MKQAPDTRQTELMGVGDVLTLRGERQTTVDTGREGIGSSAGIVRRYEPAVGTMIPVPKDKPDPRAGDDSPEALKLAARNWNLLTGGWCYCTGENLEAYYRNPRTGKHGWLCCGCGGITQLG